jgi:hypothetical protein
VQIQGGLITRDTRRLVQSGIHAYGAGRRFYRRLAQAAPDYAGLLRRPAPDETVAVQVSDRHDNIGMDPVVRAFARQAHATVVLDTGDDTSSGSPWEAFSLESLDDAFDGYQARVFVAGNHDHGAFVASYLEKQHWVHPDGQDRTAFAGVRLFGVDDPRSSGLGDWRTLHGLSFDEVGVRLADAVCKLDAEGHRVATLMVHDANLARAALDRGCADLVVAGHVHVQEGPDRVVGENGKVGYTYTNGTTGGAAYAIALGGKLRRDAEFTFLTYRGGRPVGLQPVTIQTNGIVRVGNYFPLDLATGAAAARR